MMISADALHNRLLARLPAEELQRWLPHLEPVELRLGQVLYEPGSSLSHAHFPSTSIVSLQYEIESGATAEIAVVGNEGLVGIALFMGGGSAPGRALVRNAGRGFRIHGDMVRESFARSTAVRNLLLRYTQALIAQMAQTAVCNRHHSLDQQVCRWLLLTLDRQQGGDILVTQEMIARMLGVRREGVTEAALSLQKAGLIRYARGHVSVLDRGGLTRRTCECYAVVAQEYKRLLDPPSGTKAW